LLGPFTRRHLSILVVVVLASGVAVLALQPVEVPRSTVVASSAGSSFFPVGPSTVGLGVGERAPELAGDLDGQRVTLRDLDGRPVSIGDFRGRALWITFWATWCPPCQEETPTLRDAYERFQSQGLELLAIDLQEPQDVVAEYVATYELRYRVALDPTTAIMRAYRVFGLPTHYFIDRDGVVRDRLYGPVRPDEVDERVAAILGR
jgi:peroxiredoxin